MKAITTKYHRATDIQVGRMSASVMLQGNRSKSSYVPFNHDISFEENSLIALNKLLVKLCWDKHTQMQGGHVKGGMVWVIPDDELLLVRDADGSFIPQKRAKQAII